MRPCKLGKRHAWKFVGVVQTTRYGVRTATISRRGKYRCECGEEKYGNVPVTC